MMLPNVKKSILLFLLYALATSCSPKKENTATRTDDTFYRIDQSKENDSLVYNLGLEIENSILEANIKMYIAKIDFRHFMNLVTRVDGNDTKLEQFKGSFEQGFRKGIEQVPQQIINEIENGGFYDLISSYYDENKESYSLLFRLFSEEGGINYHDYRILQKRGKFVVGDIYIYTTGETLSESMNKIFLAALPQNVLEKLLKGDDKDMSHFITAVNHKNRGQIQMAFDALNEVQGDLRNKKIYQVIKTQLASVLDDGLYIEAMEELKNTFPNDPSTNLMLVDYHILKEEYNEALDALNKLKKDTGDDFVDYIIGNVHVTNNNFEEADVFYQNIVEAYPDYWMAKLNLITTKSKTEDYKRCLELLDALVVEHGIFLPSEAIDYVQEVDKNGDNVLSDLAKSKEFQKWKNQQKVN